MEGKDHIKVGERDFDQVGCSSNPHLLYEHFQEVCVRISIQSWQNIGGDKHGVKKRSIGLIGRDHARQKIRVEWGLGTLMLSTLLC